jgi:hypothetical protein
MELKKAAIGVSVVALMGAALVANAPQEEPSGKTMTRAAEGFLKGLSKTQRQQATFGYRDKERLNWHFIPRERKGLPLKDLEGEALSAAHALIQSGLSEAGYDQALNVMSLEEVLYLLEGGDRKERRARRDPRKYYLSVFGTPGLKGKWGWRVEGHHLSLNYVIEDGEVIATTPEFFGANPGTIDAGPGRTIRVLGPEEDIARQILKLCSKEQLEVAWRDPVAPKDIRGGGVAQPETTAPVGLAYAKMSPDQQKLLKSLLNEYLKNMPADVEAERRDAINRGGMDGIHFAWWGKQNRNEPHYYRVQGPTFLIEYNNTQNSANHVHSIWRNMSGDFDVPLEK